MTAAIAHLWWLLLARITCWRLDSVLREISDLAAHDITCGSFVAQLRTEAQTLTSRWLAYEARAVMAANRRHACASRNS